MVLANASKKPLKEAGEAILDKLLAPNTQSTDRLIADQYGLDNMTLIIVKFK